MNPLRFLIQTVGLALSQIWANKVRAMLTTLGIIIAVAAILTVSAAGEGFKGFVLDQFATFGANKVWIFPRWPQGQRERWGWRQIRMTPAQVREIRKSCPSLLRVSPVMEIAVRAQIGDKVHDVVSVTGIDPEWHEIEQRFVTVGRPFLPSDQEQAMNVCLINKKGLQEFSLPNDPTGMTLLLDNRKFVIVGVVEDSREISKMFGGGDRAQTELLIPFATGELMRPEPRGMYAVAQTRGAEFAEDAKEEITFTLRRIRQLKPDDPNTFGVEAIDSAIEQFKKVAAGITAFLAGVVGISLLVGGIGIMNIMLVSVSERTHEIGLRKAVGAKPAVILMQFLVEAVVLCLVGCLIGLILGGLLVLAFKSVPDSPVSKAAIPAWAIILSVGFSAATGVIFGMFPAIKAARLDPIVALRHE